jgi:hypothetical protein
MAPGIFTPGLDNYELVFDFRHMQKIISSPQCLHWCSESTGVPQGLETRNEYMQLNAHIAICKVKKNLWKLSLQMRTKS